MSYSSLSMQARVLGALLLREIITRYGRDNLGFLWMALEPMMFTLGVTTLWSLAKMTHGSTLPITAFALTGYASVLLWRNTVGRCAAAIRANKGLLHHVQVQVIHLFAARILLEVAGATISFIVLSLLFISVGWMSWPANLLTVIQAWLLLAWFGASLGLVVGAISERYEVIDRLWHTAAYLLFPLSGAAFMVDWLPVQAQRVVLWLPMVHGVEMLRDGEFGSFVHTHYSVSYMIICCLCLSLLGLAVTNQASHHVGIE